MGPRGTRQQGIREYYITMNVMLTLLIEYYSGERIEKNEMGGACGMHGGGEESCRQGHVGET